MTPNVWAKCFQILNLILSDVEHSVWFSLQTNIKNGYIGTVINIPKTVQIYPTEYLMDVTVTDLYYNGPLILTTDLFTGIP